MQHDQPIYSTDSNGKLLCLMVSILRKKTLDLLFEYSEDQEKQLMCPENLCVMTCLYM